MIRQGRVRSTSRTRRTAERFAPVRPAGGLGRVLDVVIALAAIVFLAPLLIAVAVAVKLDDGGPVLFRQRRIGFGGAYFPCLKFRSMAVDAEAQLKALLARDPQASQQWVRDQKLRNDPRITRLGGFLRRSSLDELPQLFNVLAGDMSLVGPRPIVEAEISRYGRWFPAYASVRPGITGLWQVTGRNDVTYQRRVATDVIYTRNKSVALDMSILLRTIPAVLLRHGSY